MRLWWTSVAFDRRFLITAAIGTIVAFIALGVPAAVVPNPFFVRMTPTEAINVAVLFVSAPLVGLIAATYLSRPAVVACAPTPETGIKSVSLGTVAAYLAIGCPICNKILVAVLGVSGTLTVFWPLQPLIGAASVAMLGATLAWRLRRRAHGCASCDGTGAAAPRPTVPAYVRDTQ